MPMPYPPLQTPGLQSNAVGTLNRKHRTTVQPVQQIQLITLFLKMNSLETKVHLQLCALSQQAFDDNQSLGSLQRVQCEKLKTVKSSDRSHSRSSVL